MLSRDSRSFGATWYYCCVVVVHIILNSSPYHQSNVAYGFGNFVSSRNIFGSFAKQKGSAESIEAQKRLLFNAINGTNNGKTATIEQQQNVLTMVRKIELTNPVLSIADPQTSQLIDGTWYLQYTSPSTVVSESKPDKDDDATTLPTWEPVDAEEGSSNIETRPFQAKGSVSAAGVVVDTSNKLVLQILDVTHRKVTNQVNFDWGQVVVSGSFRQSPSIANRAIVAFDTADISVAIPNTDQDIILSLGWVFSVIAAFRNGNRDNGWLETTYVDSTLRLGRGNKGTMFILTREPTV